MEDFTNLWPAPLKSESDNVILSSDLINPVIKERFDPSIDISVIFQSHFHYINKGDLLCRTGINPGWMSLFGKSPIYAHKSGYVGSSNRDVKVNETICRIYDSAEDLVNLDILKDNVVSSSLDVFTKDLTVSSYFKMPIQGTTLSIAYQNGSLSLKFEYSKNSGVVISKNDTISFLFDNGDISVVRVESNPLKKINNSDKKICEIIIGKDCFELFTNHFLKMIRISGSSHEDINLENSSRDYPAEVSQILLNRLMKQFASVFADKNIELEERTEEQSQSAGTTCFVYIMKDEKNGCHKIGISNRPEYREKTLQSDKPFIVMLKAKEFPSRKIAIAFEQALHKAYQDKNIRGEWFELSQEEVKEVIDALK